ncbi:MAG: PolC-type DNA polymerase III, partial [Clostridia bacterium]|nr:PolC-type DNA polymerase III [Clostridia bacterium]
ITDHGVVQAFPEALKAKKGLKSDIKILYGMEAYLSDEPLTCDMVMLSACEKNDQLSAIGAVLFSGGKIADTFCRVVIGDTTGNEFIDWLGDAPVLTEDGSAVLSLNKILDSPLPNMQLTLKNAAPLAVETDGTLPSLLSRFFPDDALSDAPEEQSAAMAKVWQELIPLLEAREYSDLYSVINKTPGTILDKKGKKVHSFHAVILAKNRTGMVNLYKLVSDSNLKYFEKKRPRIPKHLFMRYREGLILGSACEAGELFRAMFQKLPAEKYEGIARFYDYLEIQPVGNNMFMLANGMVSSTRELEEMNIRIVELAKQLGKPFVATCDVHFLDAADEVYRRILMAGQGFDDADRQAPLYLRNTKQMLEEFRYLSEEDAYAAVVTNTNWVADQVEDQSPIRPDNCPPQIENSAEDLRRLCYEKATRLYGDPLPEPVQSRLEKELQPIIRQGYDVMYMIAQKLVQKSNEDGYLVGSRGSVGSSIVAFMSGITEINSMAAHYICPECKYLEFPETPPGLSGCDLPDKICPNCGAKLTKDGHDIPFETFLGFHADKQPDIDLNFSGDYQSEAHKYTEVIFGKGYCFKAGTVSTVAEKTALGYVLKYFEERGITVNNAERDRLVKGCTGVKRTTGQHPGGIIVCPKTENIYEFTPVQHPADDPTSDIITTHFDYHSIDQNLLKLDILGHDDPTVLRMLQDITGIDPQTIPLDDKKTMSLFTSTEALGVTPEDIGSETGTFAIPEFGTSFVRGMLLDTKPTAFSDLIRISGLSHGTDVWLGNAQELVKSGTCTLSGCICCRDDIMSYLISKNMDPGLSFKTMESVRKGKGLTEEMETAMREHEVPDWYIDSCKKIKYMFPKAHAAAYVTNAFRIAWYKVHYPLAFYAACFSVRFLDDFDYNTMAQGKDKLLLAMEDLQRKGKMQKLTAKEQGTITVMEVLREMYARGFSFAKIDLYESDAKRFRVVDGKLLPPFAAISGLGGSAAAAIAEARAAGEFTSKEDMKNRVGGAKVVTLLSDAGILDDMMESSQTTLF